MIKLFNTIFVLQIRLLDCPAAESAASAAKASASFGKAFNKAITGAANALPKGTVVYAAPQFLAIASRTRAEAPAAEAAAPYAGVSAPVLY